MSTGPIDAAREPPPLARREIQQPRLVVAIFTNVAALPLRSVTVLVVTGCGFVENPPLMCIFPNSNATGLKVAKHIFPMASPTNAATAV